MSRLIKKFLGPDSVDGSKIKLLNSEALRAQSADGMSTVDILKVNSSNVIEFFSAPVYTANPVGDSDLARKKYVDDTVSGAIDALVNGAPALLDTLKELADALGSDSDWATSVATQLAGVKSRLDVLEGDATVAGSFRKGDADTLQSAKDYADAINTALDSRLDTLEANGANAADLAALEGRVDTLESGVSSLQSDVSTLKGDATVVGSVAKAEADAKAYADAIESQLDSRLDALEADSTTAAAVAQALQDAKDYSDQKDAVQDGRLDVLEGDATVVGSVAKAEADAKAYADGIQSALDSRLDVLEGDATVEGSVAKAEADAKAYADNIEAGLDARLDVIEGGSTVPGSIAKAQADAEAFATALDTAMDARVDALESLGFVKEKKSIGMMEAMQGYVDLGHEAKASSTFVFVQGGLYLNEGDDYTVSNVSGVTRITFAGEFASGGATAIASGDVLCVQYQSQGVGGGGGGGGNSGGQATISIMSAMDATGIFYVYWNATGATGKYVMLQKYQAGIPVNVMGLGLAAMGYGTAMSAMLSNGDTIQLKLYDDSMYAIPTSPEVLSNTETVTISAPPPPPSPSLNYMGAILNDPNISLSWSASNFSSTFQRLSLVEVIQLTPDAQYSHVLELTQANADMGGTVSVARSAVDPTKQYALAIHTQDWSSQVNSYAASSPFQLTDGLLNVTPPSISNAAFSDFSEFMGSTQVAITWTADSVSSSQYAALEAYDAQAQTWGHINALNLANAGYGVINVTQLVAGKQYRLVVVASMGTTQIGVASNSFTYVAPSKITYVSTSQSQSVQVFNWLQTGADALYVGLERETGPGIFAAPIMLGSATLLTASVAISALVDGANYRLKLYSDSAGLSPVSAANVTLASGATQSFLVDFTIPPSLTAGSALASGSDIVITWTAANASGLYVGLVLESNVNGTPIMLGTEADGTETIAQSLLTNGGSYKLRLYSDVSGTNQVENTLTSAFTISWVIPVPDANIQNLAASSTSYGSNLNGDSAFIFYLPNPGPMVVRNIGTVINRSVSNAGISVKFELYASQVSSGMTSSTGTLIGSTGTFAFDDLPTYSSTANDNFLTKALQSAVTLPEVSAAPYIAFYVRISGGPNNSVASTRWIDQGSSITFQRGQTYPAGPLSAPQWEVSSQQKVGYKILG